MSEETSLAMDENQFSITVRNLTGEETQIGGLLPSSSVSDMKTTFSILRGIPISSIRLFYSGKILDDSRTISECGITSGSIVHLVLSMKKPVIYIFPSSVFSNIEVNLTLNPHWQFSTL
ncbi:ubiquitin family protein [Ceratobasidium sp. AG-Ba]|nr:ubiquitin family protein [Ceratobasidium sp. AG-Ba]QRW10434.1 ubiquitin family protein [Ceratobasidium sp. AG-Ba]